MNRLLERPDVEAAIGRIPRSVIVRSLRSELDDARATATTNGGVPDVDKLVGRALGRAELAGHSSLERAINATGVILHTGLGRAVLCEAARQAVADIASGHSTLEIETESGKRGSRHAHVRDLLCELTGAESAIVVNNNAGAVFLSVTALAQGREVVISRGELIEIGGSFRMPDIIRASGATLVETGTTNRTRLRDFENAITERTGLLLRCHPSNFHVVGFTEEVSASDLAALGNRHGIPVMDDLGSGAILDTSELGAGPTITLRQAVDSGCDIVTASGDKLLGGPQAGIVLGRRETVEMVGKHPLARALRVDKLTLAALEATLRLYRDPEKARREIPTLRYMSRTSDELSGMAETLRSAVSKATKRQFTVDTIQAKSQVGGGSLPGEDLPTTCVRIRPLDDMSVEELAAQLRNNSPPIFCRIKDDAVLLDPRTLEQGEIAEIGTAFKNILQTQGG